MCDWVQRVLFRSLAEAAGACELVGGQADDIAAAEGGLSALASEVPAMADKLPPAPETMRQQHLAWLESMHRRKTGALIGAASRLGALVAGADRNRQSGLEYFGRCLGLAFQITDDLLDVRGDAATLGKRAQKDADQGKLTYPGLLGVEASRRRAEELVDEACRTLADLASLSPAVQTMESLARYVLERSR